MKLKEFVEKYCIIKGNNGKYTKFNYYQLNHIKYMSDMIDKGYEPKLFNSRKGIKIIWVKK